MSKLSLQGRRRGVSLIEALIVIAVAGIVAACATSAAQNARQAAYNKADTNNLKQIGIAANAHNDAIGFLPCSGTKSYNVNSMYYTGPKAVENLGSYAYQLLPYVEEINFAADVVKKPEVAASTRIKVFLSPERNRPAAVGASVDYAWNMALNTPKTSDTAAPAIVQPPTMGEKSDTFVLRSISKILELDGASNTIMCGHKYLPTKGKDAPSYEAKDANYLTIGGVVDNVVGSYEYKRDGAEAGQNLWGGPYEGGGLFVFVDGSAKLIPYSNADGKSGKSNFAYMLRPDDGMVVTLP
jgi:prepilin-type N-terminal cleavage/methylation domain-containing protein